MGIANYDGRWIQLGPQLDDFGRVIGPGGWINTAGSEYNVLSDADYQRLKAAGETKTALSEFITSPNELSYADARKALEANMAPPEPAMQMAAPSSEMKSAGAVRTAQYIMSKLGPVQGPAVLGLLGDRGWFDQFPDWSKPEVRDAVGRYTASRQAEQEGEMFGINDLSPETFSVLATLMPAFIGVGGAMAGGAASGSAGAGASSASLADGSASAGAYGGFDAAAVGGADYGLGSSTAGLGGATAGPGAVDLTAPSGATGATSGVVGGSILADSAAGSGAGTAGGSSGVAAGGAGMEAGAGMSSILSNPSLIGAGLGAVASLLGGGSKPAGTTTTVEDIPEWLKPYANLGMLGLSDAFTRSPTGVNALTQQGGNYLSDVIGGDYLNSNPYLDAMFNRAAGKVTSGVNSQFSGAGRYGSGAHQGVLGESLGNLATDIYGGNYTRERANQQAAALGSGSFGNTMINQPFLPGQNLLSGVNSIKGGTKSTPYFENQLADILSGALGGAMLGKSFA